MGYSIKSIPFFTDDITLWPHTATSACYLGHAVSIAQFSGGMPCSLEQVEETGEYVVRLQNGDFIHGPEVG